MAVAIERHITVCHPFFKVSHPWSARRYILPILIFSAAYNAPKFGELKVVKTLGMKFSLWNYILLPLHMHSRYLLEL